MKKVKVLTIAILALLLCATVPMAATTTPKRITGKVYLGIGNPYEPSPWTVAKTPVGVIIIDTTTYEYQITCHGLDPGAHTFGMVAAGDERALYLTTFTANEHGNIRAAGTFNEGQFDGILYCLQQGKSFVINKRVVE